MNNKLIKLFGLLLLIAGCGELEVPSPEYYKGWEQLSVQRIASVKEGCIIPRRLIYGDKTTIMGYKCIDDLALDNIDFSQWDVLLYNEGTYEQITEIKVFSYLYINQDLKKLRFVIATRTRPNTSGLTSNGFSQQAMHALKIPKVPEGYTIDVEGI
ncbi:MAG: hypothetical protein ACI8ZN_002073 [Bacteroidia bacterium]|jgi:hypothetical protein